MYRNLTFLITRNRQKKTFISKAVTIFFLLMNVIFFCSAQDYTRKVDSIKNELATKNLSDYQKDSIIKIGYELARSLEDPLLFCFFEHENNKILYQKGSYSEAKINAENLCKKLDRYNLKDSIVKELYISNLIFLCKLELYEENFQNAIDYCSKGLAICEKDTSSFLTANLYNALASTLAHQSGRNFQSALSYMKKSLSICERIGHQQGIITVLSNIGNLYHSCGKYNEALEYFLKENNMILQAQDVDSVQLCRSFLNLAIANESLSFFKVSESYYQQSIDIAKSLRDGIFLTYAKGNYASLLFKMKYYDQSLQLINEIFAEGTENLQAEAFLTGIKAEIFAQKGMFKPAYEAMQTKDRYSDSLHKKEKIQSLELFNAKLDIYKKEREALVQENQLLLTTEKVKRRNLTIAFCIIVGGSILGFLSIRVIRQCKISRIQKERLDWNKKHFTQIIGQLNEKIDSKDRELKSKMFSSLRKKGLLDELANKLQDLRKNSRFTSKQKLLMIEINGILDQINHLDDSSCDEFEYFFQNVDRNFLNRLQEKYPFLTPNEKRLCALVSLQLSTKEIASITNKSTDAVKIAKFRLKKRLGLSIEDSLYDLISSI